jgi:succinate-acetate transporter protein
MPENKAIFASPGPAGLMVLAFYLACIWTVATGIASPTNEVILVALGFAGALVQMTSGIIDLRNGEILTGNMMMAFSAFMWYGCILSLLKAINVMSPDTAVVDGWIFLVMGIFMVGFTYPFLRANAAGGFFMLGTDVFFLSAALSRLLDSQLLCAVEVWSIPIIIVSIIWQVTGQILNKIFDRPLIPLGRPFIKD